MPRASGRRTAARVLRGRDASDRADRRSVAGAATRIALATWTALAGSLLGWPDVPATAITDAPGDPISIAGAFVYPVGNELDFRKGRPGDGSGYYLSDPYLAQRTGTQPRTHLGVDLSNRRGGAPVRAVASGVVTVADGHALVEVRRKEPTKTTKVVKGKRVQVKGWRWRTSWKWRNGWGNHVVIRHTLPSGETIYSLYAHLAPRSVCVEGGDVVVAGQPIGKVGRTGRASSPHLHLEIRLSAPVGRGDRPVDRAGDGDDGETPELASFALLQPTDPLEFLERHVRRFDDLKPETWESRYALAATRDGLASAKGSRFEPDASIRRLEFYRSLVAAFRLSTPFPSGDWASVTATLADAGILEPGRAQGQGADDRILRSEALEILLRCLEGHRSRAHNLASLDRTQTCRDFNREFAGAEAAELADRRARTAAAVETMERRRAEAARVANAKKRAKAAGKTSTVKLKRIPPVPAIPRLDPGYEALAQSKKHLTRAEACLLFATTLRSDQERHSALQRAAIRVAQND